MGAHKVNPFARGNTVGDVPTEITDQLGRVLHTGDMVIAPAMNAPVLTLVDVKPLLDPRAPPNHVQVTLRLTLIVAVPKNSPLNMIRVMTAAEQGISAPTPDAEGADGKPTELKLE